MFSDILFQSIESLIRNISGPIGIALRRVYYTQRLKSVGEKVVIDTGVHFQSPKNIVIGDKVWIDKNAILIAGDFVAKERKYKEKNLEAYSGKSGELHIGSRVHIAPNTFIQAHGGVHIGNDLTIACGAKIYSLSHHYRNIEDELDTKRYFFSTMSEAKNQYLIKAPVVIKNGAALGINSVVLPGTCIEKGVWIGVNALAPKITEENKVYI